MSSCPWAAALAVPVSATVTLGGVHSALALTLAWQLALQSTLTSQLSSAEPSHLGGVPSVVVHVPLHSNLAAPGATSHFASQLPEQVPLARPAGPEPQGDRGSGRLGSAS